MLIPCLFILSVLRTCDSLIEFKDQPVQNFAYVYEAEERTGPRVDRRMRLEYDHGRFRETEKGPDTSLYRARVYDFNSAKMAYEIWRLPKMNVTKVDTHSILYALGKTYPDSYRKHMHYSPNTRALVVGPKCRTLQRMEDLQNVKWQEIGKETVAGKPCVVYTMAGNPQSDTIKVWDGWILAKTHTLGPTFVVTSIRFEKNLPASTFRLPVGSIIAAPQWMHVQPPAGCKLKEQKDTFSRSVQIPGIKTPTWK